MEFVLIWFICGIAGSAILSRSNKAGTGCLLGLLFGPLGIVIALVMRGDANLDEVKSNAQHAAQPVVPPAGEMRECPFCAEMIRKRAKICRFCNREIPAIVEKPTVVEAIRQPPTLPPSSTAPASWSGDCGRQDGLAVVDRRPGWLLWLLIIIPVVILVAIGVSLSGSTPRTPLSPLPGTPISQYHAPAYDAPIGKASATVLSEAEREKLERMLGPRGNSVLGRWFMSSALLPGWRESLSAMKQLIEIRQEKGDILRFVREDVFCDGSRGVCSLTAKIVGGTRRLYYGTCGDYYVIEATGELGLYDNDGFITKLPAVGDPPPANRSETDSTLPKQLRPRPAEC